MQDTYVFIDGGHIRSNYAESIKKWCGLPGEIDYSIVKATVQGEKCFYYDCLDDILRDGENETAFQDRINAQESVFDQIQRLPGTHVRLGSMTGTAKKRRQKQVDILLAVDMLNHAVRKNMKTAVLVTGDQDFTPVVMSLVDLGLFVRVMGDRKHTSRDLSHAADTYIPLGISNYVTWSITELRNKFPVPTVVTKSERPNVIDWRIIAKGKKKDRLVTMYYSNGKHIVMFDTDRMVTTIEHPDKERLKLFCEMQFESFTWE